MCLQEAAVSISAAQVADEKPAWSAVLLGGDATLALHRCGGPPCRLPGVHASLSQC
jgi:hypothetical protein